MHSVETKQVFPKLTEPSSRPVLRIESLTKRFGRSTVVDQLSLDIYEGEFFALLGPSGCGKTTLLRLIAGFERPDGGRILLDEVDLASVPVYRRPVNMMFQSYALFPHLSVLDNVAFTLKMRGMSRSVRHAQARELLHKVGLEKFADRLPAQLSGGQQQRVALARALITNPRVLLLDEPLSALDEFLRLRMRGELRRMQKELGITFVHVTHTQMEAIAVADIVVVMDQGRIEQANSAHDIFVKPRRAYVARFIGGQNVLKGRVARHTDRQTILVGSRGERIAIPAGGVRPPDGSIVSCSIRRDRIELSKAPPVFDLADQLNAALGTVHAIEYQGTYVKVTIDMATGEEFVANVLDEAFFREPVDIGDRVVARWSATDLHILEADAAEHVEAPTAPSLRASATS